MKNKILITLCIFGSTTLMSSAQADKELSWNVEVNTIEDSQYLLKDQLNDSLYKATEGRHVKRSNRIIKTKKKAIILAKQALLNEFGKEHYIEEKKFKVHFVRGYWIVKGMLPRGFVGGTLVAVFDSESGELFKTLVWK